MNTYCCLKHCRCMALGGVLLVALVAPAAAQEGETAVPAVKTFDERLLVYPINEHVLRGKKPAAEDCAVLAREKSVKRMIGLIPEEEVSAEVKEAALAAGIACEYYPIVLDSQAPVVHVDRAKVHALVERLRAPGDGTIYLYCNTGRNLNAVVDFAYRLTVEQATFVDALGAVLQRGFAAPEQPGLVEDMKLLASGLDELPAVPVMPLADADLLGRGKRVDAGNLKLHIKTVGEGPAVFALHGGPGESHLILRPYLDALAANHTLVYFDQRGCGFSDRPPFREAYSIARLVEDLEALRVTLGHEKISLVAQSSGGPVAARYALTYPDRVEKLVIVSSWASAEEFTSNVRISNYLILPDDMKLYGEVAERLQSQQRDPNDDELSDLQKCMYPTQFFGRLTPEFREDWSRRAKLSSTAWQALSGEYAGGRGTRQPLDLRPDLAKIKDIPTLVIVGKYDVVTPPHVVRTYAEGIPGARFEIIDQCGHHPFVEQNQKFIELVGGFLAGE